MTPYLIWKTAHVLSAALLFGTGLGIAFFAWFGYRSALRHHDIGSLRTVLRLTVIADAAITAPAVVFQIASGLVLMRINAWPMISPWSIAVFVLIGITGACWLPVVRLQSRLYLEARQVDAVRQLSDRFHRRFRRWCQLGLPAFLAVLVLYGLMVVKPLPVTPL